MTVNVSPNEMEGCLDEEMGGMKVPTQVYGIV